MLLTALVLVGCFSPGAGAQFSVDRQSIYLVGEPGEELVGSFRVRNQGDTPLPIRVTPVDYVREREERILTPPAGSTDKSLLPFLTVAPTEFTIDAGGYVDVGYAVSVPETFEGSRWIAFLVRRGDDRPSATEEQASVDGVRVRFNFHVVYRILLVVTAAGTERLEAEVVGLRRLRDGGATAFDVQVFNAGNSVFRAHGQVEIRDHTGATVATLPLAGKYVLPGHTRALTTSPQPLNLEPGPYLALAVVSFDGDYLAAGQLRFTVQ